MSWAEAEFKTIDLGNARLNRRVIKIVEALGLAHQWYWQRNREAYYRLF